MKRTLLSISALLITVASYGQTPVASYTFNDGTTNDGVGTNHATNHGATLTTDRFGVPNAAFDFNPSNDAYISIPSSAALNFGTGDFTISLWFKSSAIGGTGVILNRGEGTGATRRIFIRANTPADYSLQWRLGDNTMTVLTDDLNNPNLFDGQWHHLVLVRSTQHMKFYVDGFFEEQLTDPLLAVSNHNNSRDFLLGVQDSVLSNSTPMGSYFDGAIDDVRFYDEELDIQQIIELFGEQSSGVDLNNELLGQWSFNNGTPEDDAGFNDGVNHGATLTNDRFANADHAYSFDDAYIRVDHNAALNLGSGDFSISAWFKTANENDAGVIINKGQSTGSLPRIFIRTNAGASNNIQCRIGNGNTNVTTTLNVGGLYDDSWQHVVLVKWLNHMRLYLNGNLVDDNYNQNLSGVNVNSDRPFLFGVQDSVFSGDIPMGSHFDGSLDDIRIYGRAINDAEATELFNQPNPGTVTSGIEISPKDVLVYPNPATDIIRFSGLDGVELESIELYEISGRLVRSYVVSSDQINVSDVNIGMYILAIEGKNGERILTRIMKQ